jgi:hypothetical protein
LDTLPAEGWRVAREGTVEGVGVGMGMGLGLEVGPGVWATLGVEEVGVEESMFVSLSLSLSLFAAEDAIAIREVMASNGSSSG